MLRNVYEKLGDLKKNIGKKFENFLKKEFCIFEKTFKHVFRKLTFLEKLLKECFQKKVNSKRKNS